MEVYLPLIISISALMFAIFSFWWMNWRRGKLQVGGPRSFAAKGSKNDRLLIELPFVFFNDGPKPIIVQNLRLVLPGEEPEGKPLHFIATVETLGKDTGRALASQFPVPGRQALRLICEFQRRPGDFVFEAREYLIELQAVLDDSTTWIRLCSFKLRIRKDYLSDINERFIAYDNWLPEDS
jgi:hypothetical protein